MAVFESYRRGAGRSARGFATGLLLVLLAWMCYAFMSYGNTRLDRLLQFEDPFFGKQLVQGGGQLTEWVTPSMIIALVAFILGLAAMRAWLNRPSFADLLIETEAELKRVRWAARKETNRATGVVLYFVLWFAIIMFVYDLTFTMGIGMLQGQKWSDVGWGRIVTMVFRLDSSDGAES